MLKFGQSRTYCVRQTHNFGLTSKLHEKILLCCTYNLCPCTFDQLFVEKFTSCIHFLKPPRNLLCLLLTRIVTMITQKENTEKNKQNVDITRKHNRTRFVQNTNDRTQILRENLCQPALKKIVDKQTFKTKTKLFFGFSSKVSQR